MVELLPAAPPDPIEQGPARQPSVTWASQAARRIAEEAARYAAWRRARGMGAILVDRAMPRREDHIVQTGEAATMCGQCVAADAASVAATLRWYMRQPKSFLAVSDVL
jgi:hypothetical protein